MRYIKKTLAPPFFSTDVSGLKEWIDYKSVNKRKIKQHILENEQFLLCCYCESKIEKDLSNSHLEHIRPKDKYKSKMFDYNNFLVSCDGKHFNEISNDLSEHCGHRKDNFFDENLFLDPTSTENLTDYFKYNKDSGVINKTDIGGMKSAYTILLLNLNGNNNRIAEARLIAKNSILKILKDKSEEEKIQNLTKIIDNKSVQFHSFLYYCFRK